MLRRIAVAAFATSGVFMALVGILPAFRGQRVSVVVFVLGIVLLVLAITVGATLGRKRRP